MFLFHAKTAIPGSYTLPKKLDKKMALAMPRMMLSSSTAFMVLTFILSSKIRASQGGSQSAAHDLSATQMQQDPTTNNISDMPIGHRSFNPFL